MNDAEAIWSELHKLEAELGKDVRELEHQLQNQSEQLVRRCYCRALFAYIDGLCGWMNQYVIRMYHPAIFSPEEKSQLYRREGAMKLLLKSFLVFSEITGALTPLQANSSEATEFSSAIKIRNRVTHPAKAEDTIISAEDILELILLRELFVHLFSQCLQRSGEAMTAAAEIYRAELEKRWGEKSAISKPTDCFSS